MDQPQSEITPPVPQPKKGIPVLGWLGIGCGGVLIVAVLSISMLVGWCKRTIGDFADFQRNPEQAAAEMMVRIHPHLELVSQDPSKGEMTVRTKSGEQITLDYRRIAEGKFTVTDGEGNLASLGAADLSTVPPWVPLLPGMTALSSFHSEQDGRVSGFYAATSTMNDGDIAEYFKTEGEKLGSGTARSSQSSVNDVKTSLLSVDRGGKKLTVVITSKPGEDSLVNVGYEGAK